jgi:PAS domain S-box-containing protein
MRTSLGRSLRYGIALPFAMLFVLCAGLVWQIERMNGAARRVARSSQVIAQIELIQRTLVDQEAGVRGFLLTDQRAFLGPYEQAETSAELDDLDQLLGDDPQQAGRARALRAAYSQWSEEVGAAVAIPTWGRQLDSLLQRKRALDELRALVREMLAHEELRYADRSAVVLRDTRFAEIGAAVLMLIACGMIVIAARRVLRRAVITYEAALRRAEENEMRLRRLWESNIIGVMYADRGGGILDVNDAVLGMIGYTREEVRAGKVRWNEITPPQYLPLDERGIAESFERGACTPYEKEYIAKDGHPVPILIGYVLLEGAGPDYICFLIDLTERARLLTSERAARAEAERANRLKDEFVATVSHELRTPLGVILGWARMLQRPTIAAAQLAKGLDVISRNTHQVTQIVSDLLDTSRIVTGKLSVEMEPVDPASILDAALEGLRPAAAAKGIALEVTMDPLGGVLRADAMRLRQVVENLVSNAIKFTPAGGRVTVTLSGSAGAAALSVCDTGEGITPEFLPYVFDRFRQGDASVTRRHGGLGLGLAIVKHIVELHGGSIHVASAGLGRGAEFMVMLPFAPRAADAPDAPPAGTCLAGLRVLVVDDEPDARELVQRVLEDEGAVVLVAGSGAEALAASAREALDAVVSDIGMPVMDGYELSRRLRAARGRDLPLIAITAFARAEDRARALEAGFNAHLTKPLEPATLIATLAEQVSARRSHTEIASLPVPFRDTA